jgi:hypothetical protein
MDSTIAYADFYDHRKSLFDILSSILGKGRTLLFLERQTKTRTDMLNFLKKVFTHAGKAQKAFQRLAVSQFDQSEKDTEVKNDYCSLFYE